MECKEANIKEAIELVCIGREKLLTVNECHKVVDCLKQLEKYKQMWEEVKQFHNKRHYIDSLEYYEQKYFPKPFKKTITFTIEAPTEHYLGTAINDFEMFWCNYNGVKGHCAKYYYGEK